MHSHNDGPIQLLSAPRLKLDPVLDTAVERVRAVGVPWMACVSRLALAFRREEKRGLK